MMMNWFGMKITRLVFSIADHALVSITVTIIMMDVNHVLQDRIGMAKCVYVMVV